MKHYVTVQDIIALFRPLTAQEQERADALIPIVEATLRQRAINVGKDLDEMVLTQKLNKDVLKGVLVDVIARTLLTSTTAQPMTQFSEAGMGYSVSGSFLNPGGGLFIKNDELKKLGLKRQKVGFIDMMPSRGDDEWDF